MKQSIYLSGKVLKIAIAKLKRKGINFDVERKENGGLLYVEEKDIPEASVIVDYAKKEEREIEDKLNNIECSICHTDWLEEMEAPFLHVEIAEQLSIIFNTKKGLGKAVDSLYCHSELHLTPEDFLKNALKKLENENFVIEKLSELTEQIMKTENFDESYIKETMYMHNAKDCPIWVLHNYPKTNGTAALYFPNILKKIHSTLKENYYVLPVSKQESFIIPESEVDSFVNLKDMFYKFNYDELRVDLPLADKIFYFDGEKLNYIPSYDELYSLSKGIRTKREGVDISIYTELCIAFTRLRDVSGLHIWPELLPEKEA